MAKFRVTYETFVEFDVEADDWFDAEDMAHEIWKCEHQDLMSISSREFDDDDAQKYGWKPVVS
jgi:hypothetical protein